MDGINPGIEGDGPRPHDPITELRVTRLEYKSKEARQDLNDIRADVSESKTKLALLATASDLVMVRAGVARIDSRLSQVPTIWQMIALLGTLVVALIAINRALAGG